MASSHKNSLFFVCQHIKNKFNRKGRFIEVLRYSREFHAIRCSLIYINEIIDSVKELDDELKSHITLRKVSFLQKVKTIIENK